MASRTDKENEPSKHTVARSKIPVLSTRPVRAFAWPSKAFKEFRREKPNERQPLSSIQTIGVDGGRTYFNFGHKIRKSPEKPISNEEQCRKEVRVTKVSPRGTVYTSVLSKTTVKKSILERAKHVTVRKEIESPLDWDFKALKDEKEESEVKLGRFEDIKCKEEQNVGKSEKGTETESIRRAKSEEPPTGLPKPLTPTIVPVAQHNRVKNIKRSLKRPHSRELQTRTSSEVDFQPEAAPPVPMELAQYTKPLTKSEVIAVDIYEDSRARKLTASYEGAIIMYLLAIQQEGYSKVRSPRISAMTRSIVVNWLIKVNSAQGLEAGGPQVVQSAVHFLDRVLALGAAPLERVQLLAAACYWLAQKQSAKPRSATAFVRYAAGAYTPKDLRAAERYVLRKLNWPTLPVVTDDFVPYLVQRCSPDAVEPLTTAATFLCTSALLDSYFSTCPPSVLAVAAVSTSLLLLNEPVKRGLLRLCSLYKRAHQVNNLDEVSDKLMRMLSDPQYLCREPFLLYSRPPHCVANRLLTAVATLTSHTTSMMNAT